MMKFNNKKIILFGIFTLVFILLISYGLNDNNHSRVAINDNIEISVGDDDDGCASSSSTYSYTAGTSSSVQSPCSLMPSGCDGKSLPTASASSASSYTVCTSSIVNQTGGYLCNWSKTPYSKTTTTKCTSCSSGYYLSEDKCYPIKVASVSGDGDTKYLAADESYTFTFTATGDPSSASGFAPSWSLSSTSGATGTANGASYSVTASGTNKGTGTNCATTTYTITATSGGVSKTATAKVCKYCSKWVGPITKNIYSKTQRNTSKPNQGCFYYEGEEKISNGWKYTAYYSRCCSPPQSDMGACYGNQKYLGISTDAGWQDKATDSRPYKLEGISEDDCHPINVNVCNPQLTPPLAKTETTSKCEDTKSISYDDITVCGDGGATTTNSFYRISCTRKIDTKFDYGDDNDENTKRVLFKGQGFRFGIVVTSTHTCTATFNKDKWLEVYNTFIQKVKFVSPSLVTYVENYDPDGWKKAVNNLNTDETTKKIVYNLWGTLSSLRKLVVDDYLGFQPSNNYNENAIIKLTYKINGEKKTLEDELIISEKDYTEGKYTKTESSKKFNLTKKLKNIPESFVISNESNKRVVKLIPKRAYIEKYIGQGVNNDSKNVDGGNKIYIDYYTDATKKGESYPISINLSGLGSNNSVVTNNKCDIKVGNDEIIYRSIDVNNPFINTEWKIGENWLNSKYSFTNTIKSNVWSKSSWIKVDLSSSDIDDIKASNKNYLEKYPYLGLCDRIEYNNQDTITKKLCDVLKRAIDEFQ